MMKKQRSRNLDVVHSGLVLWQQPVDAGKPMCRERMGRLLLTKGCQENDGASKGRPLVIFADQLSVQVPAGDDLSSLAVISPADSNVELTLRTVNVPKGDDGLGLSIKGGSDGTHHAPIVISKVLPGLSAALTGQVFVGDLIVEVNGISLESKTHEEVVQLLRDSTGPHVTLTLKRDNTVSPLLRRTQSSKRSLPSLGPDITVFKSALKTPILGGKDCGGGGGADERMESIEEGGDQWKTVCRIPLPLAFVSRYLWATDKLRSNAFEVRSVDGRSSGIIHCEDRKALEQWVHHIDAHIYALNRKTIRMSNKYLHAADRISYIGWLEERIPGGQAEDPRQKWDRRFLIFKGGDVCLFDSPPLNADELEKCICLYKIYETALRTAIKRADRREHVFALATVKGAKHCCSFQSRDQLHQFEVAYYNCLYKAVNAMQTRTFACSYDGRPAGLVIDLRLGFSLYDIPTKSYIWQYGFSELESSSDDAKMRVQFIFRNDAVAHAIGVRQLDVKDIECDEPLALVFTLHSFYVTKIMGADPEFLQNLPLS